MKTSYDPKWALRKWSHNISISVKSHNDWESFHNLMIQRSLGERDVQQENRTDWKSRIKCNPTLSQTDYFKCFSKILHYNI